MIGGVFKEDRNLIKRVRALNSYFSSAALQALRGTTEIYCLPHISVTLAYDTRAVLTAQLYQRTRHSAGYFQTARKKVMLLFDIDTLAFDDRNRGYSRCNCRTRANRSAT
ncbi:hypothetical protein F442_22790 [Phytophthora nicotianae P10297]|uniref:Uncharacterized protein n=1 Tax=Phytophthora nicotianae P10297 TaxID=1317064 RepID=W2XYJ3_PHYNI|nr:hypothetical protein F442_22790 [Phytophthora nicotianae P10297]